MVLGIRAEVEVPLWVAGKMDEAGYETLTWLLSSGMIAEHKYSWSSEGDIGTPATVRQIVLSAFLEEKLYALLPSFHPWRDEESRERLLQGLQNTDLRWFAQHVTAGYLLGTDFSNPGSDPNCFVPQSACARNLRDNDGRSQLEGELRRYWAQKNSIPNPRSITVDRAIIRDYCDRSRPSLHRFEGAFAATLAWQQFLK